jgi:hypothetical protein
LEDIILRVNDSFPVNWWTLKKTPGNCGSPFLVINMLLSLSVAMCNAVGKLSCCYLDPCTLHAAHIFVRVFKATYDTLWFLLWEIGISVFFFLPCLYGYILILYKLFILQYIQDA